MGLIDGRVTYAPFHYPKADEYWWAQQRAFWLHTEINLMADVLDWETKLNPAEKNLIGQTLKSFTQTEIFVNDYWMGKVAPAFPHFEIVAMASAFSNMETIHARAYAALNETLGLNDFSAFLSDPVAKAKIDNLINVKVSDLPSIAKSLAVFSGFTEGVSLFSSFAILLNFSRFNKLKGVGQIIAFSVRDESLHSEAGCWLFRTLIEENPQILEIENFKHDIYDAARTIVRLEDDFIDSAFSLGPVEGLSPQDLKQFIRFRANTKLNDLGLKSNWKNLDKDGVNRILEWFVPLTLGTEHQDFFSAQPSSYSRGVDFSKIFDI